jgi:hypothetical protein
MNNARRFAAKCAVVCSVNFASLHINFCRFGYEMAYLSLSVRRIFGLLSTA